MSSTTICNLDENLKVTYFEFEEETENCFSFKKVYEELSNNDSQELDFTFEGLDTFEEDEILDYYAVQIENIIHKGLH